MTNTIHLTNTFAVFDGPARYAVSKLLSYRKKGYQFSRAYKRGNWDGWVHLMSNSGRFAAGLAPWVTKRLAQQGIEVAIDDLRPPPLPQQVELTALTSHIEFRPHQLDALAAAEQSERGIIHHPTAAGKTVVMCEVARRVGRKGLVLVHRKDLMYQTADQFVKQLGLPRDQEVVGVIGDGLWHPAIITVATFQTLYLRLKEGVGIDRWLREEIGQVHVDEAHHLPAESYELVMACLSSARWRYGYSATPYKEGDPETFFKVASWLGPTIHHVPAEELTEAGRLVPADVFMVRQPAPSTIAYANYQDAVTFGLVENGVRNGMIVDLARRLEQSKTGPVVILVERLAHGETLARALKTDFVAGNAPTGYRSAAWEGLRNGRLNLLVTSRIADEGLDIPPLTYLIMAGGGQAPHLTIQRVGRGMRLSNEKERLFVFDFLDQGRYLDRHAKRRLRTYQEQPAYNVSEVYLEEVLPPLGGTP